MNNSNNKTKGKKNKTKDKKGNFPKRDAYERVEFLKQAAQLNLRINPHNEELSRHYVKCLRSVKEKKCLSLTNEMKRSICKGCNMILVPGVTTRVRVGDHKRINITCLTCNNKKRVHIRNKKRQKGAKKTNKPTEETDETAKGKS
ncbi:uncharacterized protein [Clytia hemisphaerica]|uniref:uncharacterized protein n=1 Tax=Clytia hemisphaerica TaxID=252671 RepID=UPI0034D65910